jgi:hypothetical protein
VDLRLGCELVENIHCGANCQANLMGISRRPTVRLHCAPSPAQPPQHPRKETWDPYIEATNTPLRASTPLAVDSRHSR